jgi:hypothetical protein
MHYRMLVTLDKDGIETSAQARLHVNQALLNDTSFCGDGGRFGAPLADWSVIGGRWSGELSRATWAKKVTRAISQLEKEAGVEVWGAHYSSSEMQVAQINLKNMIEKLYQKSLPEEFKGKGLVYDRDMYEEFGYEDDAMLVTRTLYNAFLKEYEGRDSQGDNHWVAFSDLNYEAVNPDFIGRKWLVVVDYHS